LIRASSKDHSGLPSATAFFNQRVSAKKTPQPPPPIAPAAHVAIMQIIVSLVALAAGIYFIVTAKSNVQVLAAGWVGVALGYWLR
jgi:hypothetical protein